MDAETGEALKGADGKDITASARFTPQAQDGSQDVTFTFDASELGGAKTVVFEKLFVDGTLIGSHEDPTDKDQTVEISPSLKTTAATIQGSKVVKPEDEVAIVDTVHLKGLRPGQSYTLTASINKKADGTQLTLADVKDVSTLPATASSKALLTPNPVPTSQRPSSTSPELVRSSTSPREPSSPRTKTGPIRLPCRARRRTRPTS